MPQNTHLEIVTAESDRLAQSAWEPSDLRLLRAKAEDLAHALAWLPGTQTSKTFAERYRAVRDKLRPVFRALESPPPAESGVADDFRWLFDNVRLLPAELQNVADSLRELKKIPHVRTPKGVVMPRVLALAEGFLEASGYAFSEQGFTFFLEIFQKTTVLELHEFSAIIPALRVVLLEQVAVRGLKVVRDPMHECGLGACIRSLREISHTGWKTVLEPLVLFDQILRQDPAGSYAQMDLDSRELYRKKLAKIAEHSDFTEMEVATEALALAQEAKRRAYGDPRVALRESHIGFYLLDDGATLLQERVGFKPSLVLRMQALLRKHPDEFFLPGIELLTFAVMSIAVLWLTDPYTSFVIILISMCVLLVPSSQSAIQVMNYLTTALLPAQILPKLDFSEGLPADCVTMVAVPSLLLNEKQVHGLAEDLEVRFLGNHDPNMYFALLTDLPDSRELAGEESPLVDLCARLIQELNEKYAQRQMGSFFMFHRHRVYNPREKSWMGWERKRGKLLDLNKLLQGEHDSFPVKAGELSVLPSIRYVITLDSDTELPRGSARRMVGTMAHPLNQAIIDPEKNTVVAGYGILQPRVGVSVQSTARSRLAAIYAGETGFDIYTRAVSDAYQDLYGEGIFAGKGIYEVGTVHRVLDRRFPRNSLLSHDLIEGAYARAGLASDIEVIEDYPSHYSAYNRRKHRWLRGDWQIAGWLFPHVRDEKGAEVTNPISLVSWWKIFDNLRRSLVEPAILLLLVFGWLMHDGGPARWTLATVCILLIPACFEFLFNLGKAIVQRRSVVARDAVASWFAANLNTFFTITFLAHQTLLALDAVVRVAVRRLLTRERLLEWETAAEAELATGKRRAPVDVYLNWTPLVAVAIGVILWFAHRNAFAAALPILVLWAGSKAMSSWLNRSPVPRRNELSAKDRLFLRQAALRTWRYFSEFCTEEHHWLIPDNVQEEPPAVAPRFSPTNIGFLLNARQAACEFGYFTTPELVEETQRTLRTVSRLRTYRGHLLNWYDTRTLQPLSPFFVSSVDSGNLLASLWTLQQGCLEQLRRPLIEAQLAEGLLDQLRALLNLRAIPRKQLSSLERDLRGAGWLEFVLNSPENAFDEAQRVGSKAKHAGDVRWYGKQACLRLQAIQRLVRDYEPWLLPQFSALRDQLAAGMKPANRPMESVTLAQVPGFVERLEQQLDRLIQSGEHKTAAEELRGMLLAARENAARLIENLRTIAAGSGKLANEMDFTFLLNTRRKLMSVGYDVGTEQLQPACYDLLATESRTAVFVAIAKEDIPQESWFLLGRAHTLVQGRPVLLSWTGTLFEYLMPGIWMRSYSNTLLERSRAAAVRAQQAYTQAKNIPWGISESAYYKMDEAGNYQYHAFGLPHLALHNSEPDALVISPYSTFLSLNVDPSEALRNLRRMEELGWFAAYGFYEAVDYTSSRRKSWRQRYQVVPCWMAHHEGMSLLALANFLRDNVMQRWFHGERRVQATELLLHEKPVNHVRSSDAHRAAV